MNSVLEEAIQRYLNTIVQLNDRKMPINEQTMHYLTQRVYGAFSYEIGDREFGLKADEHNNSNLILTLKEKHID